MGRGSGDSRLEALAVKVEQRAAADEGEFSDTFGATYCLEAEEWDGGPLHILYRLDDGDPKTFELVAAYAAGRRLVGPDAQAAARIGKAVVRSDEMYDFLFG